MLARVKSEDPVVVKSRLQNPLYFAKIIDRPIQSLIVLLKSLEPRPVRNVVVPIAEVDDSQERLNAEIARVASVNLQNEILVARLGQLLCECHNDSIKNLMTDQVEERPVGIDGLSPALDARVFVLFILLKTHLVVFTNLLDLFPLLF